MSSVGHIVEETCCVHGIAEAINAKVESVHDAVESKVASLVAHAKVSTAHVTGVLSKCIEEVVVHSKSQTLHVAEVVTQQLEREIQAATTSTAATAEVKTCTVVEGML